MEPSRPSGSSGSSPMQIVVTVVALVVAFAVGFLIMRVLPFWLGLPLLIVFVLAARMFWFRTTRSR